jgi:hypothetical protein
MRANSRGLPVVPSGSIGNGGGGDARAVEPMDAAGHLRLAVVHRPEPDDAVRRDGRIVQAIAGQIGLGIVKRREAAVRRIEARDPGLQPGEQTAVGRGKHPSNLGGCVPMVGVAPLDEAVDTLLLDIDEPQTAAPRIPYRALAQRRMSPPHGAHFAHRNFLSHQPDVVVVRRVPSYRRSYNIK